jgi:protein TonB
MSRPSRAKKAIVTLSVMLFATCAVGGIVLFIQNMLSSQPAQVKKFAQEVKIIRPPPPPEVEPPPPQEEDVNVPPPEEQPQQADNQPAPGDQLGLDADASGAGDGFGLMARKGGRDLLASGEGAFAWYTGMLQNAIRDRLQEIKKARVSAYSIVVRVWVKPDGSVERVKLASSTGDRALDSEIEDALMGHVNVAQAPPIEMPQPVSLRIVSRI